MNEGELQKALMKHIIDAVRVPTADELREVERRVAAELTPSVNAFRDPNTGDIIVDVGMPKHGSGYRVVYGAGVKVERTGVSDTAGRYVPRYALVKSAPTGAGPQRGDRVVITSAIAQDGSVTVLWRGGGEFRMNTQQLDEDVP